MWQLAHTKKFVAEEFAGFLELLPRAFGGTPIRHALEVRHDSFKTPEFVALMRRFDWPVVYAHSDKYPEIADLTGDFVYARLQRSSADHEAGYAPDDLDAWARRAKTWEDGGEPPDLPSIAGPAPARRRDCFLYFISGAKERNPAAAMALIGRLSR